MRCEPAEPTRRAGLGVRGTGTQATLSVVVTKQGSFLPFLLPNFVQRIRVIYIYIHIYMYTSSPFPCSFGFCSQYSESCGLHVQLSRAVVAMSMSPCE